MGIINHLRASVATCAIQTMIAAVAASSAVPQTTTTELLETRPELFYRADIDGWGTSVSLRACDGPLYCNGPIELLQLVPRDGTVTVRGEDVRLGPGATQRIELTLPAGLPLIERVTLGAWVTEGDPLAVHDARRYRAKYDSLSSILPGLRQGQRTLDIFVTVVGTEEEVIGGGGFVSSGIAFDQQALSSQTEDVRRMEFFQGALQSGRFTLRAPATGWITAYDEVPESGSTRYAYEISEGRADHVILNMGQGDVARIELGDVALIRVGGDRIFTGRVEMIDDTRVVSGSESRYRVLVRPDTPLPESNLDNLDVDIVVDNFEDGLVIPREALIRHRQSGAGVFRLEDGVLRFRPLVIRDLDAAHYYVSDGLAPGDIIVVGPASAVAALHSGDELSIWVHAKGVVGYGAVDEVSTIPGRIKAVHVEPGQPVRRGDTVISMARPLRWIADVQAELEDAKEGRRTVKFPGWCWTFFVCVRRAKNDRAILLLEQELTALRALERQLVVRAPNDGFIRDVRVKAGDDVYGDVVLTITDMLPSQMQVRVGKEEAAAAGLGVGSRALLRLDAFPQVDSIFKAEIVALSEFDESVHTVVLEVIGPPDAMLVGFTGEAQFEVPLWGQALAAPEVVTHQLQADERVIEEPGSPKTKAAQSQPTPEIRDHVSSTALTALTLVEQGKHVHVLLDLDLPILSGGRIALMGLTVVRTGFPPEPNQNAIIEGNRIEVSPANYPPGTLAIDASGHFVYIWGRG